jgi:uncharacterized protein YjbI with pentapeptide repeats
MPLFNLFTQSFNNQNILQASGPSYKGMVFNNVVSESTDAIVKQTVKGDAAAPFSLVNFNNCKINGHFLSLADFNPVPFANLVFTPSSTLAIGDVKSKESKDSVSNIKVYLTSNILNVDFPNVDMIREIQLYNILGQMVYYTKTRKANVEIDVKSINLKGVLIVRTMAGRFYAASHKVLVE